MKTNMGSADRIVRGILAVILVALYTTHVISGTVGIVLVVFAGILFLTSYVSFCPMYLPFSFSTMKKKINAHH